MLALRIARRYLFSRKSHSVINTISIVSGIAIAIPVMAMVVILSFHNGLSSYIESLYKGFDSPIRITAMRGKSFLPDSLPLARIEAIDGVEATSQVLEENILLMHDDRQHIATLRGVDSLYSKVVPIRERITNGEWAVRLGDIDQLVVGQGVAYNLGINPSLYSSVDLYAIRPDQGASLFNTSLYRRQSLQPVGVYSLDETTDNRYVFSSLEFARTLLGQRERVSSIEIAVSPGYDPQRVQQQIAELCSDSFLIQSRYQQKQTLYKMVNQEKIIIYGMLVMVMVIASLSLTGSLAMLITEKRAELQTLETMGAELSLQRAIFRNQGLIIVGSGITLGMVLGVIFSLIQQHFGIIEMAGSSFLMQAYPVKISLSDLAIILLTVALAGWLLSQIIVASIIKKTKKSV